MSLISGRQVAALAQAASKAYAQEKDRLRQALKYIESDSQALGARLAQAWEQLTVSLVPGLVAEHLNWLAQLIHLPWVGGEAVHARLRTERVGLEAECADIENHPDYIERETKLNTCAIQIAELERPLAPLAQGLDKLEAAPFFTELMMVDYGTPEYAHKWWELAYYRHWKHGDLIVEGYGEPRGLETFAQVRARYLDEHKARMTLESELARWVAERARIEALAARRAELDQLLGSLEDLHWGLTRAYVHQHLSELPEQDLLVLLAEYEPGLYAVKRIAGIQAKLRYFAALRETWVEQPYRQAERKLAKAKRGTIKYQRPKHAHNHFSNAEMQRKFSIPLAGWEKRWSRWNTVYPMLREFEGYDAFDPNDDTIWWHVMTGGAVKARFIPEVGDYYRQRRSNKERDKLRKQLMREAKQDRQNSRREEEAQERAIAAMLAEQSAAASNDDRGWDDFS